MDLEAEELFLLLQIMRPMGCGDLMEKAKTLNGAGRAEKSDEFGFYGRVVGSFMVVPFTDGWGISGKQRDLLFKAGYYGAEPWV